MTNFLKKTLCITTLLGGMIFALLPFSLFYDFNLFKIKNDGGTIERYYVINEKSAEELIKNSNIYTENEDENFDLIKFLERINGDFKIES